MKSSPRKSYCKNISGVVARCLWKWLVWVPPKLAGSAIQMDRFHNTWACSWTTTPGPNKWDLGASRLWRMQSDLFQSQSYRVPKFIFTLPAHDDISSWAGKVQVNFGTPYLGNYNFLEEARQRQNGYICQFVPPSFIHPSHVHISRYRATSIGELAISGGTK